MSIRHGLLALLDGGQRYGAQLRCEFEARTSSAWPLNVGQVYTTLARLERDGLVAAHGTDRAGHALYAITDAGRAELRSWYGSPVDRTDPPRDELAIKLAMALGAPGVDLRAVIDAQRHHTLQAMQEHTRLKAAAQARGAGGEHREDLARLLHLDQLLFRAEAELRWLEVCEARLLGIEAAGAGQAERGERAADTWAGTEPAHPGTQPPRPPAPPAHSVPRPRLRSRARR